MATDFDAHPAALERLSALVDGELDDDSVAHACTHWRENTESRASWHAYHLIGDVLRSDDLAVDPGRDAAFMQALRARLANEPVVLAPPSPAELSPASHVRSARWSWRASAAVAAGFVAVAGVVLVTRAPATSPEVREARVAAPLVSSGPAAPLVTVAAVPAPTSEALRPAALDSEPQRYVADGKLIRDARLDRYLQAHHEFAGSSALGVPSAFLRSATATPASFDR